MMNALNRSRRMAPPMCVCRKFHWLCWCGVVAAGAGFFALSAASAQQPAIDRNVRPASLDRVPARGLVSSVRFSRRAPQLGDQIEQTVSQDMSLTTVWRQGNQVASTTATSVRNHQRRLIATTDVEDGRAVAATLKYLEATKQAVDSEKPASAVPGASPQTQPVAGKTYLCRREGDKLVVTDEQGNIPPPAEFEIVTNHMEAIGRPNPLGEFLDGRTVAIGETLSLPLDVAGRLLGLSGEFGQLTRFDLTLREVRSENGAECAEFQARIEAASNDSSQMRLHVAGPLVVQVTTCRAIHSKFRGPIALSESRGSYSSRFQLISTGQLEMNLASTYRDAPR
jgi:hypothetical protein